MKICPRCRQIYDDSEQNICLNDGAMLEKSGDDAPPTLFINLPRVTDPNRQSSEPSGWQNPESGAPWQNQANLQNQPFAPPMTIEVKVKLFRRFRWF